MRKLVRILKWSGLLLVVAILCLFVAGSILYNKKYDAPIPDLHASKDSLVISKGKHLVFTTAHCVECHFKPGDSLKVVSGEEVDMAGGGFPFKFPGGVFYASNISSDKETGIGNYTDGEIARMLRYGIKRDGSVLIPAMEYQNLSDEDIIAIISYLRTLPPVVHKVPENDFNLLGKAILAFLIRPVNPKSTPPVKVLTDTTVEYGHYIAENVSNCKGCHTERSQNTGEYIGEELAGGLFEPVENDPTKLIFAPNLTPDPQTGHIYNWSFEQFKNRFVKGKLIPQSPMPWGQFKNMNETELLAIWKYLHSVKPVQKKIGAVIQDAK
ncbi:MAG: c-type cytochrome [Sphingobacteriales bacterium]|jgi:cytochrome c553|nr:c-type cytochrome [Sphingobacteriales bacterium]MBP9140842.1 c-type cytochrome [Chitinophagales bacterium]MDA0199194.1 c-type cytochrome [Bacteroidota bacterium]MBK6891176.1 c-type cytochrome [Sphingobacteriales bacterium]MBK7527000.1 c-type cytochrome [Sphingobacteriales bacterium]